jgi:hypothetical protein
MEALHIATVLKRDKADSDRQRAESELSSAPTTSMPNSSNTQSVNTLSRDLDTHSLGAVLNSISSGWIEHISSLCSCQYLNRQSSPETAILSQFLFCPCLSKYSHLDPDGTVRLKLLRYLLRIRSALTNEDSQSLHRQDLMYVTNLPRVCIYSFWPSIASTQHCKIW